MSCIEHAWRTALYAAHCSVRQLAMTWNERGIMGNEDDQLRDILLVAHKLCHVHMLAMLLFVNAVLVRYFD
jgi:hypothetical protein